MMLVTIWAPTVGMLETCRGTHPSLRSPIWPHDQEAQEGEMEAGRGEGFLL